MSDKDSMPRPKGCLCTLEQGDSECPVHDQRKHEIDHGDCGVCYQPRCYCQELECPKCHVWQRRHPPDGPRPPKPRKPAAAPPSAARTEFCAACMSPNGLCLCPSERTAPERTEAEQPPCVDCGSTTEDRSCCPLCGKGPFCQNCAERPVDCCAAPPSDAEKLP